MTLDVDIRTRRGNFELEAAFAARPGETVALLGPNGAGKSTLVATLAGLLPPEAGRVTLDGKVLDDAATGHHVAPEDRPVGVVFQDGVLFPHLSSLENVAFPLRARRVAKDEARERAMELLDRLGVAGRSAARPAEISGGEAQRVALARALVHRPRLLLLDEPLASLDVQARSLIRGLVKRALADFPGVRLLITHDPVEAMTLADRLVLLEGGEITQQGTAAEIRDAPRTPYAAELVGLNLFSGRLKPLDEGAGRIATADGEVIVAWPAGVEEPVEDVIGLLRPVDVSLHVAHPEGSARNVVRGTIASISLEGERARVRLASSPPLVAEVTLGSVSRLGLVEGASAWASFKAVEVRVVVP
ncbi:MAG: ABC transporter ATP-binding protein [Actinomycetota bacterium]